MKSAGLHHRLAAGVRADVAQHGLLIASQLLVVPLFLSQLGELDYGAWLMISALAGYVSLADLGAQTYALNCATVCAAADDRAELRRVVHSAMLLSWGGAVIALLIALAWLFSGHGRTLLRSLGSDEFRTLTAATALFLSAALSVPIGLMTGLYRVGSEYARGVHAASAQRLMQVVLGCLAVAVGAQLQVIAALHLACSVVALVAVITDVRRRHPWISLGVTAADLRLACSMVANGVLFLAITVAMILGQQGSILLLGAMAGTTAVAAFATLRTLANLARQVFGSLSNALWPETTLLHAQGKRHALERVHRLGTKLTLGVATVIAAPLLACGQEIHQVWTRGRLPYDEVLFAILLLHLLSQAWWTTSATLLSSCNRQRAVATAMLQSNLLALLVGGLLLPACGCRALAGALAICDILVCGIRIPRLAAQSLGLSPRDLPRVVLLRGLPTLCGAAAAACAMARHTPDPAPLRWIATGAVTGLTVLLLGVVTWLDREERQTLRRLIRALFLRRRRRIPPVPAI